MTIFFSLVLYKHRLSDVRPLLDSLKEFCLISPHKCFLKIFDNFPNNMSDIPGYLSDMPYAYDFTSSSRNLGYGVAHNHNFNSTSPSSDDLFIVTNPDILFGPGLLDIVTWYYDFHLKYNIACLAPLVYLPNKKVQYSAKRNPTILALLVSRFSWLRYIPLFSRYLQYHQQRNFDYLHTVFNSSYLSGCFLLISPSYFSRIGGFSRKYFLHFEDADLVRRLSLHGLTLHVPKSFVVHGWARGSHVSFTQTIHLLKSSFVYFSSWGFALF